MGFSNQEAAPSTPVPDLLGRAGLLIITVFWAYAVGKAIGLGDYAALSLATTASLGFSIAWPGPHGVGATKIRRPWTLAFVLLLMNCLHPFQFGLRLLLKTTELRTGFESIRVALASAGPLFLLMVGVIGPISEELIFRGWLWEGLRSRYGWRTTAIVTGSFFVALHAPPTVSASLIYGMWTAGYSWIRHRCGSVYASILLHITHNIVVAMIVGR